MMYGNYNNRNYDFMLQDNPININDDDYSYKWRKLCEGLRQNYDKIIKNVKYDYS